ncbi:hypothetical protein [Acidocella sp.]|jgi:hypothetical protein|uniref:hypothetical protein n=1 Tax=Acidocella sp. TaxID=50710 RepID=UPI002F4022BA
MSTYARIAGAVIAEILTPRSGFTLAQCFAPAIVAQCTEIDGITPAPQVGWSATETSGVWSFAAPVAPTPTLGQAATALVAAGLTVTSTSTPALNGVYNVQSGVAFGQQDIATEAQFISTFSEFTNGTSTALEWPLLNGTVVTFTTTTAFLNFAKVVAQFIAAVKSAMAMSGTLPAASVTIP